MLHKYDQIYIGTLYAHLLHFLATAALLCLLVLHILPGLLLILLAILQLLDAIAVDNFKRTHLECSSDRWP